MCKCSYTRVQGGNWRCIVCNGLMEITKEKVTYTRTTLLGSGSSANVYKLVGSNGDLFAIKKFKPDTLDLFKKEIEILSIVKGHPNILSFQAFREGDGVNPSIIISELQKCDLYHLDQFGEALAKSIVSQLAKAIQYIHSLGIVHRDIKLENTFMGFDGTVKLGDFGFAVQASIPFVNKRYTIAYLSPEVIQEMRCLYDIDMWALGVVTYELCYGFHPFEGPDGDEQSEDDELLKRNILFKRYVLSGDLSKTGKDFITRLFEFQAQRMTAQEAIQHQWISEI